MCELCQLENLAGSSNICGGTVFREKKPDWKHCVNFPLECGTERIGFVEELLAQWFYAGNRGRKKAVECDFSPEYDGKNGWKKSKSGVERSERVVTEENE